METFRRRPKEELGEEHTSRIFSTYFPCFGRRCGEEEGLLYHPADGWDDWEKDGPGRAPKGFPRSWAVTVRRRFCHADRGGRWRRRAVPQSQYDPASYALNFDDGAVTPGRPFLVAQDAY